MWNILRPFLSEKTLSKVSIIGQNQEKIEKCLNEIVAVDQLPRKWGGTGYSEKIHVTFTNFSSLKLTIILKKKSSLLH